MKNKKKLWIIAVIVVIVLLIALAILYISDLQLKIKKEKKANTLIAMEIHVAGMGENKVVSMYYPYYLYTLSRGNRLLNDYGGIHRKELPKEIKKQEVPVQVLRRLIDYFDKIKADPTTEKKANCDKDNYAYKVKLHYRDAKGESVVTTVTGYEGLPACWPDFVKEVNALVGEEVFDAEPKLFTFSTQWFKDTFQVKDEDCVYGTVDDMIRQQKITVNSIIGQKRIWSPLSHINSYKSTFTRVPYDILEQLEAKEIMMVQSTEEEFIAFIDTYVSYMKEYYPRLSDDDIYEYKEQDELIGVRIRPAGVTIYRSCKWQPEYSQRNGYVYIDRSGPEGMTAEFPVYYNKDGKYVMFGCDAQERYYIPFGIYENPEE